jgi:hypothetical protein
VRNITFYSSAFLTRRELFHTACLAGAAAGLLQATDFWNKKDSSAWTSDEVLQLATKSPWARDARVLPRPGRDRGSLNNSVPDLGASSAQGRGTTQRPGEVPVIPVTEVTVIWASAQPMIDALKFRLPPDFAGHYVIGVNDLPKSEGGRRVDLESVVATLQLHNGMAVQAGGMQEGKATTLFAFSKELLPLSAADKEVLFSLETNGYTIKTYFNLREMSYRGKLAL